MRVDGGGAMGEVSSAKCQNSEHATQDRAIKAPEDRLLSQNLLRRLSNLGSYHGHHRIESEAVSDNANGSRQPAEISSLTSRPSFCYGKHVFGFSSQSSLLIDCSSCRSIGFGQGKPNITSAFLTIIPIQYRSTEDIDRRGEHPCSLSSAPATWDLHSHAPQFVHRPKASLQSTEICHRSRE